MLQSKIFVHIDYRVLENEFNKFLVDNEITKEQAYPPEFNNNIIFLVWDDNRPSLKQLNKNIDTANDTPTYIASGCE
jgi:hypothetical protein